MLRVGCWGWQRPGDGGRGSPCLLRRWLRRGKPKGCRMGPLHSTPSLTGRRVACTSGDEQLWTNIQYAFHSWHKS